MNAIRLKKVLAAGAMFFLAALAIASSPSAVVSPFQPLGRPLGLTVVGPTYLAGSDAQSAAFQSNVPGYVSYIQNNLPEHVAFTGQNLYQLDPARLYFLFDYAPRVYYIYEGACYDNALGATIATVSNPTNANLTGNTFTIFPFVHSSISPVCSSGSGLRSASEPLMAGDWVQLPTVKAGQQLQFFAMTNMNSQNVPANVYYNGSNLNPDLFPHMCAFCPDNSQYIIIAYEDLYGGGDRDTNDIMFVVDVGPQNALVLRNPNTLPK